MSSQYGAFDLLSSPKNFPASSSVSPTFNYCAEGSGYTPSFQHEQTTLVFVPLSSTSGATGCNPTSVNLHSFPSSQVENGEPKRRKRREWTQRETTMLWESYEAEYIAGKVTSKTSKTNSEGWGIVLQEFNKQLSRCNIPPRTLQQAKEKINNLKTGDKESHIGEETQAKPLWYEMVNRVLGRREEIDPPFLFNPSKSMASSSKRSAEEAEDETEHNESRSSSPASDTNKEKKKIKAGNRKQKSDEEAESSERKEFLQRQVVLLEKGQERDDKMISRLVDLEEKAEEHQKEILMAIINKL